MVLHRWMVEAREPDKRVQHWKLGFEVLCIRADGHRREKRTVSQKLARSIHRCQHLMNKCAESKALILAVADDDRPLLQRRVARLIGAGRSPSAVMADMSKAFKIITYTEKEKAIAGLAALGVGGCLDWVFRCNMEQHMKVDEVHSNFEASPSEQEVWRLSPAEQRALEVGETANNATQKVAHAAKRQKDAKTSKKLRGESKLQREAVAKADQAEEDVCRQQALCLGDQDAEQAMATEDMADLDYDPPSGLRSLKF